MKESGLTGNKIQSAAVEFCLVLYRFDHSTVIPVFNTTDSNIHGYWVLSILY